MRITRITAALVLALATGTACAAPNTQHASADKAAATYQKPGPAIAMDAAMLTLARAGDTGTVSVLVSGEGAERAAISSSTGLEVLGATVRDVSPGETLRVDVRAPSEGRHYLDVVVTDALGQPRAMSVAVQVGKDTSVVGAKPADLAVAPDGTTVRTMPARETINGVVVDREGENSQPR